MNPPVKLSPADAKSRRQNLAHLAAEYNTIDNIPEELVIARTKTNVILRDATRVTDEDLRAALEEGLNNPNIVAELEALAGKPTKKPNPQGDDKKPKP